MCTVGINIRNRHLFKFVCMCVYIKNRAYCNNGQWVNWLRTAVEGPQGTGASQDDTGLNGVHLWCEAPNNAAQNTDISHSGPFGVWGGCMLHIPDTFD